MNTQQSTSQGLLLPWTRMFETFNSPQITLLRLYLKRPFRSPLLAGVPVVTTTSSFMMELLNKSHDASKSLLEILHSQKRLIHTLVINKLTFVALLLLFLSDPMVCPSGFTALLSMIIMSYVATKDLRWIELLNDSLWIRMRRSRKACPQKVCWNCPIK